jgi:hypothetical protein
MKDRFRQFRRPTDEEFKTLWEDSTIVLDANVLLNAYRYSDTTRRQLLQLLKRLRKRLWIPHQAALEFHRSRLEVMFERRNAFAAIRETIEGSQKTLAEKLSSLYRDTAMDPGVLMGGLEEAHKALLGALSEHEKEAVEPTSSPDEDPIWRSVLELFSGRTGDPYDEAAYDAVCKVAQQRFAAGRPPGYADQAKGGTDQFGDFIIWQQMLDHAKQSGKPMLLVTDDRKDDWWLKVHGRTISPRPELVAEMWDAGGVSFYMYQPDQFMTMAATEFKSVVSPEALREVRSLPSRGPATPVPANLTPDVDRLYTMMRDSLIRSRHQRNARVRELAQLEGLIANQPDEDQLAFLEDRRRTVNQELGRLEDRIRSAEDVIATLTPPEERRPRIIRRLRGRPDAIEWPSSGDDALSLRDDDTESPAE